jgi:hypothetical protein
VSWDQRFSDPIELPSRKPLVTLRDAAEYITELPKAEHDADEWQAAMEALLLVAEHDGPAMFARIGVMRALNRHVERVFNPSRRHALGTAEIEAGCAMKLTHQFAEMMSEVLQGEAKSTIRTYTSV